MIKVSYWTWMCQFTTLHISFNYTFLFCSRIWCHPVETYDQICNFNDRYDQQDYLTVRINLNDHYSLRSLCQAAFSFYVSWSCLSRLFFLWFFVFFLYNIFECSLDVFYFFNVAVNDSSNSNSKLINSRQTFI